MSKIKKQTEEAKAAELTKVVVANRFNQAAAARQLGCTRQNIQQRMQRKPVKDYIQKQLNSAKFKKLWWKKGFEGMEAEKSISAAILVQKDGSLVKADDEGGITMPDHNARHKFWRDLGMAAGIIKTSQSEGNGVTLINVIYGYRNSSGPIRQPEGRD